MILFSVTVLFLCFGILTPKELLEGFSNKGMITVALLFLISEGVRQSGALGQLIKKLLPQEKTTVMKAVSYTHLDVYKRQAIDSIEVSEQEIISDVERRTNWLIDQDVYKRQHLLCASHRLETKPSSLFLSPDYN